MMNYAWYPHAAPAGFWTAPPLAPAYNVHPYYAPPSGRPRARSWSTPGSYHEWDFYAPPPPPTHVREDLGYSTNPQRYPELHPLLAYDTTHQRVDVRAEPRWTVHPALYERHRDEPATRPPAARVRLVSDEVPWIVDVRAAPGASGVTCGDVWKALHQALQEPLQDSEWALVAVLEGEGSVRRRASIEAAAAQRSGGGRPRLIRLDWLGERTVFKGLDKDVALAKRMLLPGREECPETWVVRFDR